MKEHGVCIRVLGNLSFVPEDVRAFMAEAMQITKDNNRTVLNVAFSYTCEYLTIIFVQFTDEARGFFFVILAREEISTTIKDITTGVKNGEITVDDINENLITKCLYTHKSKDPDLLIRTSGEVRFSDFLMWQVRKNDNDYRVELKLIHLPFSDKFYMYLLHRSSVAGIQCLELH